MAVETKVIVILDSEVINDNRFGILLYTVIYVGKA